jgi:two-component system, chemotaxis family, CheB/CheR fusion protein
MRMRLLVVEDEADLATLLARRLALKGHDVHVCSDGMQALEVAAAVQPEAVLTDIAMPGMDGWELAKALRSRSSKQRFLLVAISGYQSPADYERSAEAGIDYHLAKPNYFEKLTEILESLG